jgi:prevent-host-death family protein
MAEVGVRELRDHLSRYLEHVQSGEELVITDRGRAIARVVPVGAERVIDRLVREGLIVPAEQRTRRRAKPIHTAGTVSDLIAEQRR